ncbi:hypothetical protein Naga_100033g14 [Nannochloropsis gaditana]|uniref:Uncharacterized protein n=1 Tax=Nannochloropsis gaditana TaxID=72520 RepID=W7UC89_9STRA|nr:hypothetical protein Naga_100033g14 [Nannochloropsis gaditana]
MMRHPLQTISLIRGHRSEPCISLFLKSNNIASRPSNRFVSLTKLCVCELQDNDFERKTWGNTGTTFVCLLFPVSFHGELNPQDLPWHV